MEILGMMGELPGIATSAAIEVTSTARVTSTAAEVASDPIKMLCEDHRRMSALFERFFAARSEGRRSDLVPEICRAVKIHMRVEREVLLPTCAAVLGDAERWSAMAGEAADLEELADELLFADPGDLGFSETAFTLSRLVAAHIESSERPGGVFDRIAAKSTLLPGLAVRLADRRDQLTEDNRPARDDRRRSGAAEFTPR